MATLEDRVANLEKAVANIQKATTGAPTGKFAPARSPADVSADEVSALNTALTASFAAKYPNVGSHITPGANAQKLVLSFYPVGIAASRAQEKFEEAAALQGDDYQAFGRENPGQGDFVYQALVNGQPLSDFYGN